MLLGQSEYYIQCALYQNKIKVFLSGAENVSHVTASCSESGIWQPIDFECAFDPLAVNLKEPANFGKSKKTKPFSFFIHQ